MACHYMACWSVVKSDAEIQAKLCLDVLDAFLSCRIRWRQCDIQLATWFAYAWLGCEGQERRLGLGMGLRMGLRMGDTHCCLQFTFATSATQMRLALWLNKMIATNHSLLHLHNYLQCNSSIDCCCFLQSASHPVRLL